MKESTFAGVGGLKIFTRSWQPEGKTRGVVVIIPGFNSHSGQYLWVGEQFAANCSPTHRYCPLCELSPWTMTTTPRVFPSGCHERVKIFSPPTPSKVDFFISSISLVTSDTDSELVLRFG